MKNIACIILAAGKGERMKSAVPKALHLICGRPMLDYVLGLARGLGIKNVVCVLGHKQEEVQRILPKGIKVVIQKRLLGTADAVKEAMPSLRDFKGTVLVLYADNPLLKKDTLQKLLEYHSKNDADATLLTAQPDKPQGYGRVIRDKYFSICKVVEEKDADDFQKAVKEINTGIICFKKSCLAEALKEIKPNNRKKEYYLTDAIGIIYKNGCLIEAVRISDRQEALGINSRVELACANRIMQRRINEALMGRGVSIIDPSSAFINYGARIGQDTVIYPFTVIENNVNIGKRCHIGPFAHLREGTVIDNDAIVGNFVETVRSRLSQGTLAKHFCYLGDARIGRKANIGAGTVTANFNGQKKNTTVIRDGAFIGSDTVLVAPVGVGKGSRTGAGSVVTRNVKDKTTVVGIPARPLVKERPAKRGKNG